MKTYKIIARPDEYLVEVQADSLEELFFGALLGANEIIKKGICDHEMHISQTQDIEITSHDATTLLVDFLNEVLSHTNERKIIFCHLDFQHFDNQMLRAEIRGERIDVFDEELKEAIPHGTQIMKNENGIFEVKIPFEM